MNRKRNEFKKIISSPVILGLLILFLIFNATIIFQNSYVKKELSTLNKLVDKFGYKIDDKMMDGFKDYYEEGLEKLNGLISGEGKKTYNSVSDFYHDHAYDMEKYYDEEEIKFIDELGLIEAYYYQSLGIDEVYSNYNLMDMVEDGIDGYGLSGEAADTAREQYRDLDKRFERLVENGEHKNLFFMGKTYQMHSLLYRNLFKTVIFEILILVVLITSYLLNYEFDNGTEAVTYTSRQGRNLIFDKIHTIIFSNILVTTLILGFTLILYFLIFDYSGLWKVPISSYFNTEYKFLYISWWEMSFKDYLFAGILLVYASMMIFTGVSFIISRLIRNSYLVFFTFAIVFGLFFLLPGWMPVDNNILFISLFTPFSLVMNPHIWFMESGPLTTFKYYELTTVAVWSLLLLFLSVLSIKQFKKQDI